MDGSGSNAQIPNRTIHRTVHPRMAHVLIRTCQPCVLARFDPPSVPVGSLFHIAPRMTKPMAQEANRTHAGGRPPPGPIVEAGSNAQIPTIQRTVQARMAHVVFRIAWLPPKREPDLANAHGTPRRGRK